MGLRTSHIKYFFEMFELAGHDCFDELRMCELGNQRIKSSCGRYLESINIPPFKTGKDLFTHVGFDHTSIDTNGEDHSLPLNLNKPITDPDLILNFDVITNSGTTEHVTNQVACFRNIHNLCKKNGIFIHVVPSTSYITSYVTGETTHHGIYNYGFEFFHVLAKSCEYDIIDERTIRNSTTITMRKTKNNRFALRSPAPIYIVDQEMLPEP